MSSSRSADITQSIRMFVRFKHDAIKNGKFAAASAAPVCGWLMRAW